MNMSNQSKFDFAASAELFPGRNLRTKSRGLRYMRFDRASNAVRFAIEQLPADVLLGAYMEVDEKRYDGNAIRRLYESSDYPLPRLAKVA
jgi:hypothetical protein